MDTTRDGILLALVGPAGSGKTTLTAALLSEFGESVNLSVSATTRAPRESEVDGKDYHFFSEKDFKAKIQAEEFFEWEEVHGNYYGTLKSTIEDNRRLGVDLLLDIDIKGALNFKKHFPKHAVLVFVDVADRDTLIDRIKGRGNISDEELARRLKTADDEYEIFQAESKGPNGFDYYIINSDREQSKQLISSILTTERCRVSRMRFAR